MLIGLDVGGTHTDAVLLQARSGDVLAAAKVPTRQEDLLSGILEALASVLRGFEAREVRRLCVSTTIGLNALLTGSNDPVGMLVLPGPGIDPGLFWGPDPLFHVLGGAQDHRGRVTAPPDRQEIFQAFRAIAAHQGKALGVVCKFSPKNPDLELEIGALAQEEFGPDLPVVLGSSVSGSLNFPRRMHTTWCNAALTRVSRTFIHSLESAAHDRGLFCPLVVLKADAGVFSAARSVHDPAGSMGSGPAASLLGAWRLVSRDDPSSGDALMIDVGGTTTDLALMAGGHPLLSPGGLNVLGRPTLIRSLWTRSLPLGGDSALRLENGLPRIGPDRSGPALALCPPDAASTRLPTLTDALNVLGLAQVGDRSLSAAALEALARTPGSPSGGGESLAALFLEQALAAVRREYLSLLEQVNAQPVYTIRELLVEDALAPERAVLLGGPAQALAGAAEKVLGLPVAVPERSEVANALGAALARPTRTADLYADTQLGRMSIPDFGLEKDIGGGYCLEHAEKDMREAFAGFCEEDPLAAGTPGIQIVSAESFAMLDERGGRGRIIRMRAQQPAGLLELGG